MIPAYRIINVIQRIETGYSPLTISIVEGVSVKDVERIAAGWERLMGEIN